MTLVSSIHKIMIPFIEWLSNRNSLFVNSGGGTFNVICGEITKFISEHFTKVNFEDIQFYFGKTLKRLYGEHWYYLNKNIVSLNCAEYEDYICEGEIYLYFCKYFNLQPKLYSEKEIKVYSLRLRSVKLNNDEFYAEFFDLKSLAKFIVDNLETCSKYNRIIGTNNEKVIVRNADNNIFYDLIFYDQFELLSIKFRRN